MSLSGRRAAGGYSELSKPGRWPGCCCRAWRRHGRSPRGAEVSL